MLVTIIEVLLENDIALLQYVSQRLDNGSVLLRVDINLFKASIDLVFPQPCFHTG